MHDNTNFYDELDFKYAELAICIEKIDRLEPGSPKFIIPVLTPTMSKESEEENTVFQNSSNIRNGDTKPEITNVNMTNYIQLPLARELCGGPDMMFLNAVKYLYDVTLTCQNGGGENHWCRGILNKIFKTLMDFITPEMRYIKKKSKWIVVFIGGDITNPRIIAPYEPLPRWTEGSDDE